MERSSSAPTPKLFSVGPMVSFSPILKKEALPTLLAFLEDIHCSPEFTMSVTGQLYLKGRNGGYVPCTSEFLQWVQQLKPADYPVPVGAANVLPQSVQAPDDLCVPAPEDWALETKDVCQFARNCFAGAKLNFKYNIMKAAAGERVCVVEVNGVTISEARGSDTLEIVNRAHLQAVKWLNPSLAERWCQRHC